MFALQINILQMFDRDVAEYNTCTIYINIANNLFSLKINKFFQHYNSCRSWLTIVACLYNDYINLWLGALVAKWLKSLTSDHHKSNNNDVDLSLVVHLKCFTGQYDTPVWVFLPKKSDIHDITEKLLKT